MRTAGLADRISSWSQWRQGKPERRTGLPQGLSGRSRTSSPPHSWRDREGKWGCGGVKGETASECIHNSYSIDNYFVVHFSFWVLLQEQV